MAEAAGAIDGAQQRHQYRQRTYRMKTVGMRRQTAHRMERHRVAGHAFVFLAPPVCPRDRQLDRLVACGNAHFVGDALYRFGRNAGDLSRPFRRAFGHPLFQELKGRLDRRAIRHVKTAEQRRVGSLIVIRHGLVSQPIPPVIVVRTQGIDRIAFRIAHHHAEILAGLVLIHQLTGIGVAGQKFPVI